MKLLRRGMRDPELVMFLQQLLEVPADGHFGAVTEDAVRAFQLTSGLIIDGRVGPKTWRKLWTGTDAQAENPRHSASGYWAVKHQADRDLCEVDIANAAIELGVELATIKAVNEVESSGSGFVGGKVKILFEGHVFWRQLKKHGKNPLKLRAGNEDILYPKWTRRHYAGGVKEHDRLERARAIHREAALESASWGLFQIMGYHHAICGWDTVAGMVKALSMHERHHLRGFVQFILHEGLDRQLRAKDWVGFARRYNGSGFKGNKYDTKLEAAYQRYFNESKVG